MPEHDVAGLAVAFHRRRLPVDALHDRVVRLAGVAQVAGAKGVVERAVAARPHVEAAAAGGHVVDVAHHAEVERVAVAVAAHRRARAVAERQDAVDAADALRRLQLAGAEHLLRHGEDGGVGGQHAHDPRLGADAAVFPVVLAAHAVRVLGEVSGRQRADPGVRIIPLQGWRRFVPQRTHGRLAISAGGHHATLDQVPVALEETQLFKSEHRRVLLRVDRPRYQIDGGHRRVVNIRVAALTAHPGRRIVVPLVPAIGNRTERRFDVVPAPLILQRPRHHLPDECTPPTCPRTPVQLRHQLIFQHYVQPHVRRLAHTAPPPRAVRRRATCRAWTRSAKRHIFAGNCARTGHTHEQYIDQGGLLT